MQRCLMYGTYFVHCRCSRCMTLQRIALQLDLKVCDAWATRFWGLSAGTKPIWLRRSHGRRWDVYLICRNPIAYSGDGCTVFKVKTVELTPLDLHHSFGRFCYSGSTVHPSSLRGRCSWSSLWRSDIYFWANWWWNTTGQGLIVTTSSSISVYQCQESRVNNCSLSCSYYYIIKLLNYIIILYSILFYFYIFYILLNFIEYNILY